MNRSGWLDLRRESIGASDAVILLRGPKFGKDEMDVLRSKLDPAEEQEETDDIRRGKLYEPIVLGQFRKIEREINSLEFAGIDDPMALFFKYGNCHASLDGLAKDRHGNHIVVEVKCPRGRRAADTELDGATQDWEIQSRYQQAIYHLSTEIPQPRIGGVVVVWHSEQARYHKHPTSQSPEQWEESLSWVRYCQDWYHRHVMLGEPLVDRNPPVPLRVYDTDHLCNANEEMICKWYQRACATLKEAEEDKRAASVALEEIASHNTARRLMFHGGRITRIVQSGRKSVAVDRLRADHPGLEWEKYERQGADFLTWRVSK